VKSLRLGLGQLKYKKNLEDKKRTCARKQKSMGKTGDMKRIQVTNQKNSKCPKLRKFE
jgi:hypothetical protein